MAKKVAIVQSNYIPWKGYFDLLNLADEFILYDTAQYTKNDWRNRNRIKTPNGPAWLTIPVRHKHLSQTIKETRATNCIWRKKHWKTLQENYKKAPYFINYVDIFGSLLLGSRDMCLSVINNKFLYAIRDLLGSTTKITQSSDYALISGKTERIVSLCKQAGASEYISGPAAKSYLRQELFEEAGIKVSWMDYSGYPEYRQLFPPFVHEVSILDLLFNEGPKASKYMKSFGKTEHSRTSSSSDGGS
jgi:hypothetical protein